MANLSANNIIGYTIPTEGYGWANIVGQNENVVLVNPAKVKAKIAQILSEMLRAIRKFDLKMFSTKTQDVCRIEDGNTNPFLKEECAPPERRCPAELERMLQ